MTHAEGLAQGFALDLQSDPGLGFVECALGAGQRFAPAEEDIRNPYRNAALMPENVPIIIIHGTADRCVDVRHSVSLYARLLGLSRPVQFFAIENGDHGLAGAARADEDSRLKATFKYAGPALRSARRKGVELYPAAPVRIPVRGGIFEVVYPKAGAALHWRPSAASSPADKG